MNTLACAKLSALSLYRRIFSVDRYPWFKYVFWATVTIIAMWYVTWDVLSCVQCPHFSDYWTATNFVEVCKLNPVWANGLAVTDLILDLWVMIIPIPFVSPPTLGRICIWSLKADTQLADLEVACHSCKENSDHGCLFVSLRVSSLDFIFSLT